MNWEIYQTYFDVTLINEHGQLVSGSSFESVEAARADAQSRAATVSPPSYAKPTQSGTDLLEELGL